jgi:hypothetical protein
MVDDLAGTGYGAAGRNVAGEGEKRNFGFRMLGVLGFRVQGLAGVREDLERGRGRVLGLRVRGLVGVGDGGLKKEDD